jgi:hypothetical protein
MLPCPTSRNTLRHGTQFFFITFGKGRSPGVTSPRRQLTLATTFGMVWVFGMELYSRYMSATHNIDLACRSLENLCTCA